MDAYEATRIVLSRIQNLDPENAPKIMGLLLIQDCGEKEMIRLAFGPETLLHSLIFKAKKELGLLSSSTRQQTLNPSSRLVGLSLPYSSTMSSPWPTTSLSPSNTFSGDFQNNPDDLISPKTSSYPNINGIHVGSNPSSYYGGDLIDDFQLHDQLSFLNNASGSPNFGPKNGNELFYQDTNWGSDVGSGFGWKPCLYFARGFCKNGSSCRFLHGVPDSPDAVVGGGGKFDVGDLVPTSPSFPFLNDTQRAAVMMLGEDSHKFNGRSMRMERNDFSIGGGGMVNPSSRQIYLTFPADSTFREEDVSNYFSIYGPVQDVRIPYQQKRMFGFVTFVYPETVKLILAKGNPHFVCDARVLVKPYKEKGKVSDKKQQNERGDFSACMTPTSIDSRDAYDLQLGARMFYNSHEALLRRKLEEQADLQQAIELQGRRLMGLHLLEVKKRNLSSPLPSPHPFNHSERSSPEALEEKCPSPAVSISPPVDPFRQELTDNHIAIEKDFQESLEHNLPDSPFASPTKSPGNSSSIFSEAANSAAEWSSSSTSSNNNLMASSLLPTTSTLDMASLKSCYFQMPRFSSGQGAIEM
ncbi:zinc finger CCCH domain-containing protein 53-like isoform X2 [Tasmannia lanceolata]|uniref:zinc finger CCCH domain-containing protein 53-like isoform X2 n=1 Tax=Tasmannia lanceolata TaxID=3420 RepID=UPI004062A324